MKRIYFLSRAFKAWSISAIKSSASSIPTDNLIKVSEIPSLA